MTGARRHDSHVVVHRKLLIGGVEIRIVAAGTAHSRSQIIGDQESGHSRKVFKGMNVSADPGGQLLVLGGFCISVGTRAQHHHEQRRGPDFAGNRIVHRNRCTGPVDETFFARLVYLAKNYILLPAPTPVELAEATVAISFRMNLPVLFPSQLQRQMAMLLQLRVQGGKIREHLFGESFYCVIIVAGCDFNDEGEFMSPANMDEPIRLIQTGYRNMGKPLTALLTRAMGRLSRIIPRTTALPGGDRQSLSLKTEQRRLIEEVSPINANTVVCLVTGSIILVEEWSERVPAILYSWYGGMEGGNALCHVLFGDVNPSGRLPFTIPASAEHLPYFSSTDHEITYDLYHGYTLLDKTGIKPAYSFGFGLGYTSYSYSDLRVEKKDQAIEVKVRVTNTGSRDGEEVVQVYVGIEASAVERQTKLLKGFEKVTIPANSTKDVNIFVPLDELRYYDEQSKRWQLEPGVYRIAAGPSSDDAMLLRGTIRLH